MLEDLILPIAFSGVAASALTFSAWKLFNRYYVPVPPNRALVLYGRRTSTPTDRSAAAPGRVEVHPPKIVVGGGVYVSPWHSGKAFLSLEPIDTSVTVRVASGGPEANGPGWEARVSLQVKIPAEAAMLRTAAENLLDRTEEEIRALVGRAVEGAVPPLLARLEAGADTVDWERLAVEIQASAARDLVVNGLAIRSLSVTELRRLAPEDVAAPRPTGWTGPSLEVVRAAGERSARLQQLEARLDRTERNLGNLGAEVIRMARDGTLFPDPPGLPPYNPPRGSSPPGARRGPVPEVLDGGRGD